MNSFFGVLRSITLFLGFLWLGMSCVFAEGAGASSAAIGAPNIRVMNQTKLDISVELEASNDRTGNAKQRYSPRVFDPIKAGRAATSNANEAAGGSSEKYHVGFKGAKMKLSMNGDSTVIDFDGSNSFDTMVKMGGEDVRVQGRWTPLVWVVQVSKR